MALVLRIAPRLDQAAAEELAELCGYLPLALRVAARTLAERVTLKPAKYIEQFRSAQERLEEVDAALESSLEFVVPAARALWLRLGVFPGDFDAAAAAAVGHVAGDAAERLLGDLVQWDLLEYDEATERYRLHDLARDHARSRLDKAERYAAERRHAEHFLEVADDADDHYNNGGAAVLEGLALFDREWANIRTAQAWAIAHTERDDVAARIACDLPLRAPDCLSLRQSPHERIHWIDAGLVAARRLGQRQDEGIHLGNLGNAYFSLDNARKAIGYHEQHLAIARELGDRRGEATACWNLGLEYEELGDLPRAIELIEVRVTFERAIGHPDADKHEARVNELRARLAAQQAGGGTPPDEV